jgi:hypothetical protein
MQGETCIRIQFQWRNVEVLDLAEANGANYTYTANVTAMSQLDEIQVTGPMFTAFFAAFLPCLEPCYSIPRNP